MIKGNFFNNNLNSSTVLDLKSLITLRNKAEMSCNCNPNVADSEEQKTKLKFKKQQRVTYLERPYVQESKLFGGGSKPFFFYINKYTYRETKIKSKKQDGSSIEKTWSLC